jgi:hypothetical protein
MAKRRPGSRRLARVVEVLVVQGKLSDLDHFAAQPLRRKFDHRPGQLAIERGLAQATDQNGDISGGHHRMRSNREFVVRFACRTGCAFCAGVNTSVKSPMGQSLRRARRRRRLASGRRPL